MIEHSTYFHVDLRCLADFSAQYRNGILLCVVGLARFQPSFYAIPSESRRALALEVASLF